MPWLISIPVWGDKYREVFIKKALPALRAALEGFPEPFSFLIHTDDPEHIKVAMEGLTVHTRQLGPGTTYVALQHGHSEAIALAPVGSSVALLNADIVVSKNLFTACANHINGGMQAVVLSGIRTDSTAGQPPIGAASRELLKWAWEHRHQIIKDLEWGTGGSMLPTNLFWTSPTSVVMHGFHLHPVAIKKTKPINFISTIDGDLLNTFPRESIHLVENPDDMSMLEISDPGKRFPVRDTPTTAPQVAGAMVKRASELHRWQFQRRLVVVGDGADINESGTVSTILRHMGRR